MTWRFWATSAGVGVLAALLVAWHVSGGHAMWSYAFVALIFVAPSALALWLRWRLAGDLGPWLRGALCGWAVFFALLYPAFRTGYRVYRWRRSRTSRAVSTVLDSLEAFRKAEGRWPKSLDELVARGGTVPRPLLGLTYHYQGDRAGRDFRIYIGPSSNRFGYIRTCEGRIEHSIHGF